MSKMEDVVNEIAEQSPMKEWKVKYGVYENIDKHLPFSAICDFAAMALETVEDHYDCCDVAYYTEEMRENYELKCKCKNHYFHGCFAFVQLHCTPSLICPTVMPEKATSQFVESLF